MPQQKPDFIAQRTMHEAKAVLCPYCGRPIQEHQRVPYPSAAVGAFASVYRCAGCRRFVGEPKRP